MCSLSYTAASPLDSCPSDPILLVAMTTTFRIGVTRDFLKADGTLGFGDIGLDLLDEAPRVEWEFLAENTTELRPDQIRGYDGLLVLASIVSAETLQGADKLAIVARFGVGYDSVDVAACNERGVLLTITPDGVRRPVAVMALTYLLALSHKMLAKDRLVREGRWHERLDYIGMGVIGRTLGLVGLGNIGREICTLAKPFGIRCIAADPFVDAAQAQRRWCRTGRTRPVAAKRRLRLHLLCPH